MKYKEYLFTLIETMPISNVLEIGVFEGKFAKRMLNLIYKNRPNSNIKYTGIDIFEEMNEEILEKENSLFAPSKTIVEKYLKKECPFSSISLIQGFSDKVLPTIKEKISFFDLIYIDGGHSIETISNEWKYIKQYMNKNCIVVFDDYYEDNNNIGAKFVVDNIDRNNFNVLLTEAKKYNTEIGVLYVKQAIITYKSRFDTEKLINAKNVILENIEGNERDWEKETEKLKEILIPYLNLEYNVCDFGCGTGRISKVISSKVKKIYAVDKSEKMLDFFQEEIDKKNIDNIYLFNLIKYMKEDFKFDIILAIFVLQHISYKMLCLILDKFQKDSHEETRLIVINTPNRYVVNGDRYIDDGIEIKKLIEKYFIKESDIDISSLGDIISKHHFASIYRKK